MPQPADGPATAWAIVACCSSVLGVVHSSWRWLLLSSAAIGWGFWTRQTNGFLLLGPLVAWASLFLSGRLSQRTNWLGWLALLLPAGSAFGLLELGLFVDSNVSRFKSVSPAVDASYVKDTIIAAYGAILLLGWFMLPWMYLAVREATSLISTQSVKTRRLCLAAGLTTAVASAFPFAITGGRACLTNSTGAFIQNAHFGPIFLSDMDEPGRWSELGGVTWPISFWKVLSVLAIFDSAVLAWWFAWTICEFMTPATRCVIPIHLYGYPAPVQQIEDICADVGLELIVDCAQAHGTFIGGQHAGNFGSIRRTRWQGS